MKPISFFLGSNSAEGFHSLYRDFAAGEGDFLHVIKAGPGTGKSTFMRRIGQAAGAAGQPVEYILCSGDPDSLDGVYLPALKTAWVDGTAPHVLDPEVFGVTGDYVNLGAFCDSKILRRHSAEIRDMQQAYRGHYRTAYGYLTAAGRLHRMRSAPEIFPETEQAIARSVRTVSKELFPIAADAAGSRVVRRFLRAISCRGNLTLSETLRSLCCKCCWLENESGLANHFLTQLIHSAVAAHVTAIVCPDPLCPELTEAVLFPELQTGFIACGEDWSPAADESILPLDRLAPGRPASDHSAAQKTEQLLIRAATQELAQAKAKHDKLEQFYRPALDTAALNRFTDETLQSIGLA